MRPGLGRSLPQIGNKPLETFRDRFRAGHQNQIGVKTGCGSEGQFRSGPKATADPVALRCRPDMARCRQPDPHAVAGWPVEHLDRHGLRAKAAALVGRRQKVSAMQKSFQ